MRSTTMNQNSLGYLKLGLFGLLLALLAPLLAGAQTTMPPTPDFEERARKKTSLDRESKEVADEYADVLFELQSLVRDYHEYLSESDSRTIAKYLVKLELFSTNLDRRVYVADRKRLSEDLAAHIDELRVIQEYIEDSDEIFPKRILKLVASFRRDLANIDELLESDVLQRLSQARALEDAIEAYVDALLADMQIEQHAGHTIITIPKLDEKKLKEMELQAEKMARDAEKMAERSARVKTKVVAPKAPKPGDPPIVIDLDRDGDIRLLSLSGTSKALEDTLTVTNPKRPIEITNSLGEVHVSGTQSRQIVARLRVEISADTRSREKQLLSDIQLELKATPTGYTVESATPMNNNPGTDSRVVSAELEVLVPATNPVTLNSSFGDITVSELNAGIRIVSTYAQVVVEKVRGGVDISNTMGQVEIDWCSGPIKIKNAYSDITLNECNGTYDLENAYSQIMVEGCEGSGEIQNSGVVQVTNHTGNLKINNSFGPINVEGMSGDLTANNQFSPLSV
ncbi:MAG: hypothetical protein NDJ18_06745, partial [candidate division Zixibacteria bacterium]|nr:hypothetical protein [candidate division Zixibacteria bacterium]